MAPYNSSHYGSYYDPANSSNNQRTSYAYQQPTSPTPQYLEPTTTSSYQPATHSSAYSSSYSYPNNNWYATGTQNQSASDNRAAETLSRLSAQHRRQSGTATRASSNTGYEWGSLTYGSSSNQASSTAQTTQQSSGYGSNTHQPSSTTPADYSAAKTYAQPESTTSYSYGSYGQDQLATTDRARSSSKTVTQSSSATTTYPSALANGAGSTQQFRPSSPYIVQQTQRSHTTEPTYTNGSNASSTKRHGAQSPVAVAATVGHTRVHSMTPSAAQQQAHQANSSQYANQSRQSVSIEPSATVDPSQVYDPYMEQQRKAQIGAEQKRKAEEAKKAEEARKAEDEARRRQVEEDAEGLQAAKVLSQAASNNRVPSETTPTAPAPPASAAEATNTAEEMEAQMRDMFKKMREFNAKDPSMLARLWEEERQAHIAKSQSPAAAPSKAPVPAPSRSAPTTKSQAHPAPPAPAQRKKAPLPPAPRFTASATQIPPVPASSKPALPPAVVTHKVVQPGSANGNPPGIWPPGKKIHLAKAAAKWLNEKPDNTGKTVTADSIVALLDSNPSYIVLCETLEKMGLSVDRAAFARALLAAVPDLSRATGLPTPSKINPTQPLVSGAATATPTQSAKSTPSSSAKGTKSRGRPRKDGTPAQPRPMKIVDLTDNTPAPEPSSGPSLSTMYQAELAADRSTVVYQSNLGFSAPPDFDNYAPAPSQAHVAPKQPPGPPRPSFAPHLVNNGTVQSPYFAPRAGQPPRPSQAPQPSVPTPKPRNKEEAARKRNFADLVDLTADDDDDVVFQPNKIPNLGQPAGFSSAMSPSLQPNGASNFQQYMYNGPARVDGPLGTGVEGATILPDGTVKLPEAVEMAQQKVPTREEELRHRILVEPIRRAKVARKSTYDPKTIARDVLLATGRHPEMTSLNQHLMGMSDFLKAHSGQDCSWDKFDLSTVRWDLIDPGEPLPEPKAQEESVADDESVEDADDEDDEPASVPGIAPASRQAVDNGDGTLTLTELHTPEATTKFPTKRRRGRPPRHTNHGISSRPAGFGDTPGQNTSVNKATNSERSSQPARTNTMPPPPTPGDANTHVGARIAGAAGSGTPPPGPAGYSAFRQYDENGNPIKKKGRPVGWRKSIHSKAAQTGELQNNTPELAGRSRRDVEQPNYAPPKRKPGRPPKEKVILPEPDFKEYICGWQDCGANLHNLETLRKHVLKVHGKPLDESDKPFRCLWKDCASTVSEAHAKGKAIVQPLRFKDVGTQLDHIEETHLRPIAWELGDGPRGGLSGASIPEQSSSA